MGNCAGMLSTCQGDDFCANDKSRRMNQDSMQIAIAQNKELEMHSRFLNNAQDN